MGGSPTGSPVKRNVGLPTEGGQGPAEGSGASTGILAEKQLPVNGVKKRSLKRATFVLPSLSITYPISSQGEPWSQKVLDDRKKVGADLRGIM